MLHMPGKYPIEEERYCDRYFIRKQSTKQQKNLCQANCIVKCFLEKLINSVNIAFARMFLVVFPNQ